MTRDIHLTYQVGDMTHQDQVVLATICLAPFHEVAALVTGVFRATQGRSIVIQGEMRRPNDIYHQDSLDAQARRAELGDTVSVCYWGVTVSEPAGSSGVTLVEHWGHDDLPDHMGRLRTGLTMVTIESLFERKTLQRHGLTLRQGGTVVRRIDVDQGMAECGWSWFAEGPTQPWEAADRYAHRYPSKRLDRALLFDYARHFGVDLQSAMAHRKLAQTRFIKALDCWDPTEVREATTEGEAAYKAALEAGIGEPEPQETAAEAQAWARSAADLHQAVAAAEARIRKATSPDRIWAVMRDLTEVLQTDGIGQSYAIGLFPMAVDQAHRLDLQALATRRLEQTWIAATAATDFPVTQHHITIRRGEAQRQAVLSPIARRHTQICKSATAPTDLLPILADIGPQRPSEMDLRFRLTALQNAYHAACRLDPEDRASHSIAGVLDNLHGQMTGRPDAPSLAAAIRKRAADLAKRRRTTKSKRSRKQS
ncbi:hypothetical protein [Actibacterium sp. 188UL27-1]|uniref:hypothetical protein n=1 Tax=Actibacterium sp. 188UL27-1 TaxID=2786961 RepID=UPI001956697B|nr:hypothetical protein [Actibacterium sp. 188UL27-1]MBM7069245.1 hypothetical protein [Actibacterium sp. 188UL27-1]